MATMFKTMKAQMGTLGLARVPLRLQAQSQQMPLSIQHVRMTQKPWRARLVFQSLDRAAEKIESSMTKAQLEEMEDDSLFIPFPLTIQQHKPVPYKGSDPEWQEFIKFSKDPALGKRIKEELADMLKTSCEKHPLISMRAGKEMKVRRIWLDVDFPTMAPPIFEQSGLEFSDDGVTWTQQPIDPVTVTRLNKVLWPVAPAKAFIAFHKALAISFWNIGAAKLGFGPVAQPTIEALLANHAAMAKAMNGHKQNDSGKSNESTSTRLGVPTTRDLESAPKTEAPVERKSYKEWKSMSSEQQREESARATAGLQKAMAAHFSGPVQTAKITLLQNLRPSPSHPPRGSLFVSGLVELDCPNAWIVLDVKAAWDPKTREYDKRSMTMQLRRMQMKKQPPAKG